MKRLFALLLALILFTSVGCMNAHSLDRYGYVLAIGFDEGETMPLRITLMLQNTMSEGTDSQTNSGFTLVTAECRGLFEAIETLSASLPFQLDLARTAFIVVSATLAQRDGGVPELLNMSLSRLHIRYNANLFISVDDAHDVLSGLSNKLDPSLSKMQVNFGEYANMTGLIPMTNITTLFETMLPKSTYDAVIPLCGVTPEETGKPLLGDSVGGSEYAYIGGSLLVKSSMKTGLAGAAVLRDGRMAGFIDGQRVQLLLMALGEFTYGRMHLPLSNGTTLSVQLHAREKPATAFRIANGAHAQMTIPLVAYIESPERLSGVDEDALVRLLEDELARKTHELFLGCQRLGADTFAFGRRAVRCFHSVSAWEAYDWEAAYRTMDASFSFLVEFVQDPGKSALE